MDSLASLALATEEPKAELLERPPYRKKEYIINQKMIKHIIGQTLWQAVWLFFFIFAAFHLIPEDKTDKDYYHISGYCWGQEPPTKEQAAADSPNLSYEQAV